MKRLIVFVAVATTLFTLSGRVSAALITNAALITPAKVVDFGAFSGPFVFGPGPVEIGLPSGVGESITWKSSNASTQGGSVIGRGGYGLASNGSWSGSDDGKGFTGLNDSSGVYGVFDSMTYTFNDGLKSGVGGFINYAFSPNFNYGDVIIAALDNNGNVLESYDLSTMAPIFTPGGSDAGAFRGILRGTADIRALRITDGYVVLDDLRFNSSPNAAVPEPTSLTLLAIGISGMACYGWRRRKQAIV